MAAAAETRHPFGSRLDAYQPSQIPKFFDDRVVIQQGARVMTRDNWEIAKQLATTYVKSYFLKSRNPVGVAFWDDGVRILHSGDVGDVLFHRPIKHDVWLVEGDGNQTLKAHTFHARAVLALDEDLARSGCDLDRPHVWTADGSVFINSFLGWRFPTDREPHREPSPLLVRVLDHIRDVWASGNEQVYAYILKWFARVAQGKKNRSVLFLNKGQGTGKSCITDFIKTMLGPSGLTTDHSEVVFGTFNGAIDGRTLVILEEMAHDTTGQWLALQQKMKELVTGPTLTIHKKYQEPVERPNLVSLCVLTNNFRALAIEQDDRRFACLDVSNRRAGDTVYFQALHEALESEAVAREMWHYLRNLDVGDFNEMKVPQTATKADMRADQLPEIYRFMIDAVLAGAQGLNQPFAGLYADYSLRRSGAGSTHRAQSKVAFSAALKAVGLETTVKKIGGHATRYYVYSHAELYEKFEKRGFIHEVDEIPTPAELAERTSPQAGPA